MTDIDTAEQQAEDLARAQATLGKPIDPNSPAPRLAISEQATLDELRTRAIRSLLEAIPHAVPCDLPAFAAALKAVVES